MTRLNPISVRIEELVRTRRSKQQSAQLPSPDERKALRVGAGITQREIAKAFGVHSETFGRWERGDGRPGRKAADAYAQALEILRRGDA
jgi:DNA-binding transcriptional regulator YiaG